MIHASVNGEARVVNLEAVDTIGDLLQQLEVYVAPHDVVVGLRINGVECDDDAGEQVRALPVVGVTEIDLQTRSPATFAGEAQGRFDGYLAAIAAKFHLAIECFDRGIHQDAFRHYARGVEELRLLVTLYDKLTRLGNTGAGDARAFAQDLQLICDRLWGAQDRRDLPTLRGILADSLVPLLERWRANLGKDPTG